MTSLSKPSAKTRKNFFPYELMNLLSNPLFEDSITWTNNGHAFIIINYDIFAKKYYSLYHKNSGKILKRSFTRKLNRWGFKMCTKQGPYQGIYYHEYFKRDDPKLCENMRCNYHSHSLNEARKSTCVVATSQAGHDHNMHDNNAEQDMSSLMMLDQEISYVELMIRLKLRRIFILKLMRGFGNSPDYAIL